MNNHNLTNEELFPDDFFARSPAERQRYLETAADTVRSDQTIRKPLTAEQGEALRYRLQTASIQLADQQDAYDKVKENWREKLKESRQEVAQILEELRTGFKIIHSSNVYDIRDYDSGKVISFAPDGTEISTRPMLPEERQSTLQSGLRKVDRGE